MKASEADILIIPGHGNAGQDHWQSRWEAKLASARRVDQRNWHEPTPEEWIAAIIHAIDSSEKPVVLVAHSLGVPAAIHAVSKAKKKPSGGFFVSPPDLSGAERPLTGLKHAQLQAFGPYPSDPLPFPSITVASRNDPHGSYEHAGDVANAWGSLLIDAGQSGHLNAESGHGPWPEGTMVFARYLSQLKPLKA